MLSSIEYVALAEVFTKKAIAAGSESEREAYVEIAGAYARLASDAAWFEARYGSKSALDLARAESS